MKYVPLLLGFVPFAVSALGAALGSVALMAVSVPLLFVTVRILPFCRKRENLFMFVYSAAALVPINVFLLRVCNIRELIGLSPIRVFTFGAIMFIVLFAVEELALGLVTRLIWGRQYALPDFEEE